MGTFGTINFSFNGGILKFGVTGIYLTRTELMDDVDANTELNLNTDNYKTGSHIMYIAGGRLTLPISMLPTLSVTVHNAFDKRFEGDKAEGISQIERNTVVGLSITPRIVIGQLFILKSTLEMPLISMMKLSCLVKYHWAERLVFIIHCLFGLVTLMVWKLWLGTKIQAT